MTVERMLKQEVSGSMEKRMERMLDTISNEPVQVEQVADFVSELCDYRLQLWQGADRGLMWRIEKMISTFGKFLELYYYGEEIV